MWQAEKRLMLGERGGKKIEGFDLGKSPLSVTKKIVNGKRLFMSTTNGTKSLEKFKMLSIYSLWVSQTGKQLPKKLFH